MGGMTGLYVGLSGIQTSSNALNTTANNLANVDTVGYVRQQVVNKDLAYNIVGTTSATTTGQVGTGVAVATINHVRDILLDASYRKENGRQNFYEKMYDSIYEIETQMGETDGIEGIAFQSSLDDLREAFNELSTQPTSQVAISALTQSATVFIKNAQLIYSGLKDYQDSVNTEVISTVARINDIGASIVELNRQISKIESGVETAMDLRDTRDALLDELSSYCKISYDEDSRGVVTVSIEGVQFADELGYTKLGLKGIEGTSFVDVVWPSLNNQSLYNLNRTISTDKNTDIGGLKGLLVARGTITPTYADMIKPDAADYAGGETDVEYLSALNRYNLYTSSSQTSTIVNTLANFDKLVNGIIEGVNDILCPDTTVTAADGTVYTVLDTDKASVSKDKTYGIELFTRAYCDRYEEMEIDGTTYYVRNDTNSFGVKGLYSIMDISVNAEILSDYSKMPLTKQNGEEDFEKAEELIEVFSKKLLTYNGGNTKLTFEMFYENMMEDVSITGRIYNSMVENETSLVNSLDDARQQVIGVSSDEEISSMIKFQQAYNAASRYINVVSEMLETLINRTGV